MIETEVVLDERLFTVNCAFNLCGCDQKSKGKYETARKKIKKEIQEKKIKNKKQICEKINKYPVSHLKSFSSYLSNPPEFKLEKEPPGVTDFMKEIYDDIKGIEKQLRIIYKQAELSKIWKENQETYQKCKKDFENSIDKYKPVKRLTDFLEIDSSFKKINCIPSVLEGMSIGVPITEHKANMIISIPWRNNNVEYSFGLTHELTHLLLKPVIRENKELIQQSSWRRKEAPDNYYYQSWKVYLEETLARVIGLHIYHSNEKRRKRRIKHLKEKQGFTHAELISREIKKYEETDETFDEFLPKILRKLAEGKK